jgi:uncharacterized membrane protein
MKETLKIGGAFLGVFLCGGLTGMVVHQRLEQTTAERHLHFAEQQAKRLSTQLKLDAEQLQQIRPVVLSAEDEIRHVRRKTYRRTVALMDSMDQEISSRLNDAQRALLERDRIKRHEAMETWLREHPRATPPSAASVTVSSASAK